MASFARWRSPQRSASAALPEVPALAETVPGFEASAVTGLGVPKGTPADVIEVLNKAVQAAFADPA